MSNDAQEAKPPLCDLKVRRFSDIVPKYHESGVGVAQHELEGVMTGANIAAGVTFYQDCNVDWRVWYDEVLICHHVFGKLEIEMGGRVQRMYSGDML